MQKNDTHVSPTHPQSSGSLPYPQPLMAVSSVFFPFFLTRMTLTVLYTLL